MKIVALDNENLTKILDEACSVLRKGGLAIYPTETCYGVAVLATNTEAVGRLLEYKHRPEGKAISVAVADMHMAEEFVELNDTAKKIYNEFLPGPVTVISKSLHKLAPGLEAEDGSQGVRIPGFPFVLQLISKLGFPITATSANSSGKKTPYKVSDILDNLSLKQQSLVSLIIDAGELAHNPPSTVIDTTKEDLKVLRQGDFSLTKASRTLRINSPEEMQQQGRELVSRNRNLLAEKPLLVLFNADLGAGKTQFIKGMADELGIKEVVNSPTFVLLKEYRFNYNNISGTLVHMDAWRLETLRELEQIDPGQYFVKGNVIAVEWAGMAKDYLESLAASEKVIKVYIEIKYASLTERDMQIYE